MGKDLDIQYSTVSLRMAMSDGGINHQIPESWLNWATTLQWKILRYGQVGMKNLAVKTKIWLNWENFLKNRLISAYQGKIYHFTMVL